MSTTKLTSEQFKTWFNTFLSEKSLSYVLYEIKLDDTTHLIGSDTVIDLIKNASIEEQATIKNALVYLDFKNTSIHDYFKHLGSAYIKSHY